ncbi:MAG: hypothetical protein OEW75_01695 [Cyclobacteriaceae bacterium]|nr:hypothetical protein [Cyclobacteriaceae bacterium]
MKTTMKITVFLFGMLLSLFLFSCGPARVVPPPTAFAYSSPDVAVDFYTTGSTGIPSDIDWAGEVGIFVLDSTYKGVYIDSLTGEVSWTQDLQLGNNPIKITAMNSEGQISTNIVLKHSLSGIFTGGYNIDTLSVTLDSIVWKQEYLADSVVKVDYNTEIGTNGIFYLIQDNGVFANYTTFNGLQKQFKGKVVYSPTVTPYIEGFWKYPDLDTKWRGYFKVNH